MKKLFFTIFILPIATSCFSQTYALLDRRWYKEVVLTDTITRQNLSDGWFPVYKQDIDSLIIMVSKLKYLRKDGLERKFYYAEDFKTEHNSFQIDNIKRSYGDGYEINMTTTTSLGSNTLKLADPKLTLIKNQELIRAFLDYLELTKKNIDNPKKKKKGSNNPLTG
jgi:hypothetical protein